ncbi:MAG: T9SS type A sorting domain-containing protein [Bacteroidota bacterium]
MKTRYLSFFLILFFFSINSYASHYMGGEITWQCLGNGHYRFIMKLYRECHGISFNTVDTMRIINYPGLNHITMALKPGANPLDSLDGTKDGITDISPSCGISGSGIQCLPTPTSDNTGAVQEWYYTSDAAYPNGVPLSGVPPATGWVFSYTSCCRNPCSNLNFPTGASWFIRAVMYPYNGTDAYPCYDSSPVFAESPSTVICSGTPYLYHIVVNEPEFDSVSFSWAPALNGSINNLMGYPSGYSYSNPLPSATQDTQNVAAQLDSMTGQISYTTFTNGAYVTVVKVTEYRNGIKIGEVFREFQYVVLPCSGNVLPAMAGPFYNPISGLMEFTDTVNIGDLVDFDLTAIDYGTLPNGNLQTLTFTASAFDFGEGYTNPSVGCPHPPCATLNPPPIISAMLAVASHFHWQTSCDHMTQFIIDSNFAYSTHDFYFQVYDNYCPIPACLYKKVSIVIKRPLVLPQVISVTGSAVHIVWDDYPGYGGLYYIYRAVNSGPFILVDSVYGTSYYDLYNSVGQICLYKILIKDSIAECDWWSAECSTQQWMGIEDQDAIGVSRVYPNPANDAFNISIAANATSDLDALMINAVGMEVGHEKFTVLPGNNEFNVSTAKWADGIYIVKLSSKNLQTFFKVSVIH